MQLAPIALATLLTLAAPAGNLAVNAVATSSVAETAMNAIANMKETTAIVEESIEETTPEETYTWNGEILNATNGTVEGPSGKETFYNLNMDGVVAIMRNAGYNEAEYPYWARDDGCKMLGDYIMVAADQSIRPLGSIVETSRGLGIVTDTGTFIYNNPYAIDIAVTW